MNNFALYRLPYATEAFCIESENPALLLSASKLDNVSGFVFAPFVSSAKEPIVVINGEARQIKLKEPAPLTTGWENSDRKAYEKDFNCFHDAIARGQFSKLVLSRCSEVETNKDIDAEALFAEACRNYPRMMIALVKTTVAGTWLMATPEVLVTRQGDDCHTMALAGTMAYDGDRDYEWSGKNMAEHSVVADYLYQNLLPLANDISRSEPYTVRAGNLVHLRSDFSFTIGSSVSMGKVVEALHPTPAVCGMPKQEAMEFILANENVDRKYYSGYLGPWNIHGSSMLFVALRCMEIKEKKAVMHAGGGIMEESTLDSEWQETVIKMEVMRRLIL